MGVWGWTNVCVNGCVCGCTCVCACGYVIEFISPHVQAALLSCAVLSYVCAGSV